MPTIYVGQKGQSYNVINCTVDGETYDIIMSTVSPLRITKSNTITNNPLVTGDVVKDHSFVEPNSLNIDGTLSVNDGVNANFNTRLKQFEDLMTRIKDEGVLCTIYKVYKSKSRFQKYDHMALQSITFTERENSLDFSFGFVQILHADIEPKRYDTTDPYIPSGKPAETLSFTEEYFDWKDAVSYTVEECKRRNIVDSALVDELIKDAEKIETRMVGTLALGGVSLIALFIPGAREIAIAGFIGAGISAILNSLQAKSTVSELENIEDQEGIRREALWKFTNDVEENEKNKESFLEFTSNIAKQLLKLNNQIFVYKLNLETDSEVYASINNKYYVFDFIKRPGFYNINMYDIDGNLLKGNVSTKSHVSSFEEINGSNAFYRDGNVRFYLIRDYLGSDNTIRILAYIGNPNDYKQELTEIISSALTGG